MPKYHTIGELCIELYCENDEFEFRALSTGNELPGLLAYVPLLGDEFWEYDFRLEIAIEAEGERNYFADSFADSRQGWETRGVQSVVLKGRRRGTSRDQISRDLEPDDADRLARMFRNEVDNAELSADE